MIPLSETIIVALLSLLGSLGGTLGGIAINSKLSNYRIEQLEKKVDKHNKEYVRKTGEGITCLVKLSQAKKRIVKPIH